MRLDDFLPYRLARLSETVSLDVRHVYRSMYGLNRPEWRVLASLSEIGPATATAVGAHSAQHKTKVSRAVRALEQRRWLTRSIDPDDRRSEVLALTRAGEEAFDRLAGPIEARAGALLDRLDPADRQSLLDSLAALETALGLRTDAR